MNDPAQIAGKSLGPAAASAVARELHLKTIALIAVFLIFHHSMLTIRVAAMGIEHQAEILRTRTILVPFGALLCYAIFLVLRQLTGRGFLRQIVAGAILSLVAAAAHGTVWTLFLRDLDPVAYPGTLGNIAYQSLYWHLFYFAWTSAYLALCYSLTVREQARHNAALVAEAQGAQIRALRYQINPHFLFNTLNSIAALIGENRRQAETMVLNLSEFFRSSLTVDPLEDVRLADEIALQQVYLEIERVRFPNRLRVAIDLPEPLSGALVPSLILQPLIENAVKHGVARSAAPTRIAIAAASAGDVLRLSVLDDADRTAGQAPVTNGAGVGLANVRNRLRLRYGDAFRFESTTGPDRGFTVTLELPLRY